MSGIQIPEGTQQLTNWMKFHESISATQMEPRRHTATHSLDGISWGHVSNSIKSRRHIYASTHLLNGIS